MEIKNIKLVCDGYINCKSNFYTACDILSEARGFDFNLGANYLNGEIDSGIFAISYLISMYQYAHKGMTLFSQKILANDIEIKIEELSKYACYMDSEYPLFSTRKTVKKLIEAGLKKTNIVSSIDEIKEIFGLDNERLERPISQIGNERFRAMSAIAYAHGKQIFCFPWLSKKRFEYYSLNITYAVDTLSKLGKIVIIPVGN